MKFGLEDTTIAHMAAVFSSFPEVEEVMLYGSRAKGNYKNGSDIDLTFTGNSLTLSLLNKISLKLDDLYLPYTFDLSVFNQIDNTDLREHIQRVGTSVSKKAA